MSAAHKVRKLASRFEAVMQPVAAAYEAVRDKGTAINTNHLTSKLVAEVEHLLIAADNHVLSLIKRYGLVQNLAAATGVVVDGFRQVHYSSTEEETRSGLHHMAVTQQRLVACCLHNLLPVTTRMLYQQLPKRTDGSISPDLVEDLAQQVLDSELVMTLSTAAYVMNNCFSYNQCSNFQEEPQLSSAGGSSNSMQFDTPMQLQRTEADEDTQQFLAAAHKLLQLCTAVCRVLCSGGMLASSEAALLVSATFRLAGPALQHPAYSGRIDLLSQLMPVVQQSICYLAREADQPPRVELKSYGFMLLALLLFQMQQQQQLAPETYSTTTSAAAATVTASYSNKRLALIAERINSIIYTAAAADCQESSLQQYIHELQGEYNRLLLELLCLSADDYTELCRACKPHLSASMTACCGTARAIAQYQSLFHKDHFDAMAQPPGAPELQVLLPVVLLQHCSTALSCGCGGEDNAGGLPVSLVIAACASANFDHPRAWSPPYMFIILQQTLQLLQMAVTELEPTAAAGHGSSSSCCTAHSYHSSRCSHMLSASDLDLFVVSLVNLLNCAGGCWKNCVAAWHAQWQPVAAAIEAAVRNMAAGINTHGRVPVRHQGCTMVSAAQERERQVLSLCHHVTTAEGNGSLGGALLQCALAAASGEIPSTVQSQRTTAATPGVGLAAGPQQLLSFMTSVSKVISAQQAELSGLNFLEDSIVQLAEACVQGRQTEAAQQQRKHDAGQHVQFSAAAPWVHLVAHTFSLRALQLKTLLTENSEPMAAPDRVSAELRLLQLCSYASVSSTVSAVMHLVQSLVYSHGAAADEYAAEASQGQQASVPIAARRAVDCSAMSAGTSAAAAAAAAVPGTSRTTDDCSMGQGVGLYDWRACYDHLQLLLPHAQTAERLLKLACLSVATNLSADTLTTLDCDFMQAIKELDEPAALLAVKLCATRHSEVELLHLLQRSSIMQQLPQLLQGVGEKLAALLPVQYCCNNPQCRSVCCSSELALVGGKQCVCGGCKLARYCSKECQQAAWHLHKPVCKRLKRMQQPQQQQHHEQGLYNVRVRT